MPTRGPSSQRIAVLWVDGGEVTLFVSSRTAAGTALAVSSAESAPDGSFTFPVDRLEDVCAELDRAGFVWAVDRYQAPRTWAERMLAEVPARLWDDVVAALLPVLRPPAGDPTSWSVLRLAWENRAGNAPRSRAPHPSDPRDPSGGADEGRGDDDGASAMVVPFPSRFRRRRS